MLRLALYVDTVAMAFGTIRANKMRSFLTVLGIVIGIMAIVGMTSLIRGFDSSVRDMIREMGPKTIYVMKSGPMMGGNRQQFLEIMKRPNISLADARALKELESLAYVDIVMGTGGPGGANERVFYKSFRSKQMPIVGTTERYAEVNALTLVGGRYISGPELEHRRDVVVLGNDPAEALFAGVDPIGKRVRIGPRLFTVVGVLAKRLTPGGLNTGADNIALIPHTVYSKTFGLGRFRFGANTWAPVMIACVPRDDVARDDAMREIESVMRARHALKADKENDFGLVTQDSMMSLFDQITQATYLGLVVLSSIALMVGGIGVMAIMMISVTERTREIGLRKALGARRREILWQFLLEAGVLTSVGGVIGIALGSGLGLLVHYLAKFPVSLPVSSFVIGFGFSAAVGIFFGMYPAFKASRLDPIEALRYE